MKKQVEALIKDIGLKDALGLKKWQLGVETMKKNKLIPATSVDRNNTK